MTKRKSGKELRKDYKVLLDETKAIRKRIIKRAKELLKQHPDVPYGKKNAWSDEISSVSEYMKSFVMTPQAGLNVIEKIEQWIADQHPHQQLKLFKETEQKDFIEYQDDGDEYEQPERKTENEILEIRLYCLHEGCMTYIKGKEGYNGSFYAETGQYCDLRNQGFMCKKHSE